MDALFQRNQCPSLSPTARWGLWVLIISLLSICRGGATNHTTIKTLIYCCPAPGDWAPSLQGRIKPSLLLVPVVSGHRWSPDVRWNCVNSQLYHQLQRLSHPGPPSRVTIWIGSDHPGHQLAIVPDITTHMVTLSPWEHQKQIERRRSLF